MPHFIESQPALPPLLLNRDHNSAFLWRFGSSPGPLKILYIHRCKREIGDAWTALLGKEKSDVKCGFCSMEPVLPRF